MNENNQMPSDSQKEIIDLIQDIIAKCKDGEYIYRGVNKEKKIKKGSKEYKDKYRINSAIYREYSQKLEKKLGYKFNLPPSHIQEEFLKKARVMYPRGTHNEEILTDLRHFGAPTNLIDFSYNLYIALFFACNGGYEFDGELILYLVSPRLDNSQDDSVQIKIIRPSMTKNSKNRVLFQSSVFVKSSKGYIPIDRCEVIPIPQKLKKPLLEHLIRFHNISQNSVYNDLVGFIRNEKNFESSNVEFLQGLVKINSKKYKEAIKNYDKAIKINPQFAEAYVNRGLAEAKLGQYKEAIQDYDKAIEINPQFAESYVNRVSVKAKLGQYKEAIKDCDKAIEINPELAEAYVNRGSIKAKLGQYKEAIQDYDKAIEINPELAETYGNRGNAKAKLGQYKEAIKDYDKAIEINPELAGAYVNRGNAKFKLEQYEEAIQDYDKAIEINPELAGAYVNRGNAKDGLEQYGEAIQDYDKAIEINPELAGAYVNRGSAKGGLEQYEEAIQDLKKAKILTQDTEFSTQIDKIIKKLEKKLKK